MQQLIAFRVPFHAEVVLEAHLPGQEGEEGHAHAKRCCRDCRDAALGAGGKDHAPGLDGKEIQAVDVEVNPVEKGIEVLARHALIKAAQVELGVDVERHRRQHLGLVLPQVAHGGARLAVEVRQLEAVEVSDAEPPDPEAGERQQVTATDAAHARNRDTTAAQPLLLGLGHPAKVAVEGAVVVEVLRHRGSSRRASMPLQHRPNRDFSRPRGPSGVHREAPVRGGSRGRTPAAREPCARAPMPW